MGRVLRIGAGVMGVLLVVMTAGLWIRRATTEPEYAMVFVQSNNRSSSAVIMREPELNYARQISPTFVDMKGFWRTSSRTIGLVLGRKSEEKMSTIYRLRLDPFGLHKIDTIPTEDNRQTSFAPNNQWLAYEANGSCFLRNFESGETRNLADLLPEGTYLHCARFSDDSRWAGVFANFGDGYRPVMMRISDNYVVRLEDERFEGVYPTAWSLGEQWLIGTRNSHIYRSNPNEIQWQPVVNTSPAVLSTAQYQEDLLGWLPEEELVIIRVVYDDNYHKIIGVPFAGGVPQWTAHDIDYVRNLNHPQWLFFKDDEGKVYRMHPDGTDFFMIADLPADYDLAELNIIEDQNGTEWLYIGSRHYNPYLAKIWRVQLDGSHFEVVTEEKPWVFIGDYSPDHQWLLLQTLVDDSWYIYWKAKLDGSDKQFVLADPHSYFFDWSLSPTKPAQPVLLLLIGSGLIGISILGKRPYPLMRQRLRPAA